MCEGPGDSLWMVLDTLPEVKEVEAASECHNGWLLAVRSNQWEIISNRNV